MAIDPFGDDLELLSELVKRLPRRPSPATRWRWQTKGINGAKLEVVRISGRVYSTKAALADFIAKSSDKRAGIETHQPAVTRSASNRRRLRDAGLLDEDSA
ncbi:MAG: DUF1580 domain-containing protein [Pirellulaceae bacterium]